MKLFLVLFSVGVFSLGGALSPAFGSGFYLNLPIPRAPFITSPDEEVHELVIDFGSISRVQQRIDEARQENPAAVLVIRLRGNFDVRHAPLKLGSRMNLVLEEGASLTAHPESASHTSIVADNIFRDNSDGGVITHSENGVVARNAFGGEGASVTLSGQSQYNLVTYNSFGPDSRGASIAVDGKGNSIYYNEIGVADFSLNVEGEGNIIASHRGLSGAEVVENLGNKCWRMGSSITFFPDKAGIN